MQLHSCIKKLKDFVFNLVSVSGLKIQFRKKNYYNAMKFIPFSPSFHAIYIDWHAFLDNLRRLSKELDRS